MNNINWKREIIKFLTAQNISLFGTSLVQYAIIWYITLETSSGSMMTLSVMAGFIPQILISLYAGVWLDRFDRKKIAMLADAVIAVSTGVLIISFMLGKENIWLIFIVMAIRSAGTGIQSPAVNAILPQIVPKDELMRINGINTTLSSTIMFLSPAVSGMLLGAFGTEATLAVDLLTAVIGIGITLTIKLKPIVKSTKEITTSEQKPQKSSAIFDIKEGFSYLKTNPIIKNLMIFQLLIYFSISPSAVLTPLLVSRSFGAEVWRLSLSEMCYSIGLIVGGLSISIFGKTKKTLVTSLWASMFYGIIMIGIGIAPIFPIYIILNTLIGLPGPWHGTPITVTIQEKVPQELHGRIFSLMQVATSCAIPIGMMIFGPLADIFPVQNIMIFAGILAVSVTLYTGMTKKLG